MRTSRIIVLSAACAGVVSAGWFAGHQGLGSPAADATAGPDAGATPASEGTLQDGTFTGDVVSNEKGEFEASVTIAGGVITDVAILKQGTDEAQSQRINKMAGPQLIERILAAQSWQVEAVSGASYTSDGVTASVRDALAQAGAA